MPEEKKKTFGEWLKGSTTKLIGAVITALAVTWAINEFGPESCKSGPDIPSGVPTPAPVVTPISPQPVPQEPTPDKNAEIYTQRIEDGLEMG